MAPARRRMTAKAGLLATAALVAIAAAPPRPARDPALTPARYKLAIAPVRSCEDFFRRAASLPDATPLLRTLFRDGIAEQAPGESADAFVGRVVARLFARLGDPSRLATAVPIGTTGRYDASTQTMTLSLSQPFAAVLDSWSDTSSGRGGQGATRTKLRAEFGFPSGALPREIPLPMTPAQATAFRMGAGQLRILSLFQDYGTEDPPATGSAQGATSYRLVRLTPKCAIFTIGAAPVPGWRFDGWSAAPQAE